MTTTQIPSDVKKLILAGLLPLMGDIISELISDKQIRHNQVKTGNNLVRAIDPFVNELLKGVCMQSADEQVGIQSWFMGVLKQQINEANGVKSIEDIVDSWKNNIPIQPTTDDQKDCIIKYSSDRMNDLLREDMMDDLLL